MCGCQHHMCFTAKALPDKMPERLAFHSAASFSLQDSLTMHIPQRCQMLHTRQVSVLKLVHHPCAAGHAQTVLEKYEAASQGSLLGGCPALQNQLQGGWLSRQPLRLRCLQAARWLVIEARPGGEGVGFRARAAVLIHPAVLCGLPV